MVPVTDAASRPFGEELVRLASADNFRDVTGPGYRTPDGPPLRAGVLYRSNELGADPRGRRHDRGARGHRDLRPARRPRGRGPPRRAVPGAVKTHLEVKGIPMDAVATLATVAEADG